MVVEEEDDHQGEVHVRLYKNKLVLPTAKWYNLIVLNVCDVKFVLFRNKNGFEVYFFSVLYIASPRYLNEYLILFS